MKVDKEGIHKHNIMILFGKKKKKVILCNIVLNDIIW